MHVERRFAPEPSSVSAVRQFVGEALEGWDKALPDATLLVSELATNAVLHARSPFVVDVVGIPDDGVRVGVSDDDPRPPRSDLPMSAEATDGRGLMLVVALASRWGCDPMGPGKRVWFEVS